MTVSQRLVSNESDGPNDRSALQATADHSRLEEVSLRTLRFNHFASLRLSSGTMYLLMILTGSFHASRLL